MMKTVALAAAIGLAATLVALGVLALGGARLTALDWSVCDRWLRARESTPANSALVVVVRDPASESRFGTGAWDRVVLARLITGLSRAGAAVIGVDAPLGQPSGPAPGGATSDALLSQAIALADSVVFPIALELTDGRAPEDPGIAPATRPAHRSWPALSKTSPAFPEARPLTGSLPGLTHYAKGVGHMLTPADPDGVVRRVPLFVRVGERGVPAYGLSLAAAFLNVETDQIPVDRRGRMLISVAGPELSRGHKVIPLADVWKAIEQRQAEALQSLVADRIVLLLVGPGAWKERGAIHANLLVTVLTRSWLREGPAAWTVLGAFLLSGMTAWLWLALRWWKAAVGVTVLALGYVASLLLSPSLAAVVLPLVAPLVAVAVSSASALLWNQLASSYRVRHLEGEVAAIREALVRQESSVEGLEEDLEAARAAIARSTGGEEALRAQLAAARAQEEHTRTQLERLERESRTLDPSRQAPLGDAEQERLRHQCERMGIVTRDRALLAVFQDLEKAARSSLPILITGEPGTGKELFSRAAHRLSLRVDGPFVAVNMAAIPAELFESEMFGHLRGSFTGAVGDRKGFFEQANRGTIFLDEVGELRPDHQSKLLRVLQDKSFYRIGATRPPTVDVRVVAASNRDLERGVADGWFREDLYFRLKELVLRLSPLRERRQDIALLADGFDMQATARTLGWDRSTVTQRLKGLGFRELVEADGDRARAALALAGDPALGRTVELKLREYSEHLLRVVAGFDSPGDAIAACRRRFKNLPERHFRSLELLVRQYFDRRSPTARV